jgi:hypothetical protein
MNTQIGEPAFDNINELLSDRIIKRTKENVDSGNKNNESLHKEELQKHKILPKILIIILLLLALIMQLKKSNLNGDD